MTRITQSGWKHCDKASGARPRLPAAWMRGEPPIHPDDEESGEYSYGSACPSGDGWVPLYRPSQHAQFRFLQRVFSRKVSAQDSEPWDRYGCSQALYLELRAKHSEYARTPLAKFAAHKASAAERGIPFELTLEQWWTIWNESGHYHERGVRVGQYNMARKYDRGGYTLGNVDIVTVSDNHETRWWMHRIRRIGGPSSQYAPSDRIDQRLEPTEKTILKEMLLPKKPSRRDRRAATAARLTRGAPQASHS